MLWKRTRKVSSILQSHFFFFFAHTSHRGGVIFWCSRTSTWKVCQDGFPQRETGWNYSQSIEEGEDGDLPPFGVWSKERRVKRETERDYSEFRVEMVCFCFVFVCLFVCLFVFVFYLLLIFSR